MFELLLQAGDGWENLSPLPTTEWVKFRKKFSDVFSQPCHQVRVATGIATLRLYGYFPDPLVHVYLPGSKDPFMTCCFEEAKTVDLEYQVTKYLIDDIGGTEGDLEKSLRATANQETEILI